MNIQDVILGFLMDEPTSGYDIKRRFEASIANFFEATFSGIYPALRKLEKAGLISKQVIVQEGKPNKNLFAITESGKQAFFDSLRVPTKPTVIHSDMLVHVFFGKHVDNEQVRKWVEEELQRTEKNYAMLCQMKENHQGTFDRFVALTLDYGIANAKAALEHISELKKRLEEAQG